MAIEVQFHEWKCNLVFGKYNNNRVAIELEEIGTKDPVAVATVNIPDIELKQSEIILKTYSENEGMLECLRKADVVSRPVRWVETGFVKVPIVLLLANPDNI